jgi:CRP/FNR family transcriptional regulator, cyclic AMP receptor protein
MLMSNTSESSAISSVHEPEVALAQNASVPVASSRFVAHSIEEQIAKIHLFEGLRPEALKLIAHVAVEETHAMGTVIFRYGDVGEKLYLILEGRIRICREVQGMGEEALAVISAGEFFGEMALLDGSNRSADAKVHERCRLLSIHRDAFEDLLFVHKDLAYEVLWNIVRLISQRLRETNNRFAMLSTASKF